MAKASGPPAKLQAIAPKLAKASPKQAAPLLYQALQVAVLAGLAEPARAIARAMYATPPAKVVTALSTHAIDVFADAAGLGDLTGGRPTFAYALVDGGSRAERVAAIAKAIRVRLTENAFAGEYPTTDAWRKKPRADAWYAIDRWRRVQGMLRGEAVTAAVELDALARLREILADDDTAARPVGGGHELVLALELALRHGATADVERWLALRTAWLERPFVVETMMCVPAIIRAMLAGALRPALGAPPADVERALADVLAAAGIGAKDAKRRTAAKPARAAKPPKIQRRTVEATYAQVHLEPAERSAAEARQLYFQDPRESAQGMSIFPTMVGLATPSETGRVDVAVTFAPRAPALGRAVQAVTFPLTVRGPLVVRGVADPDDVEPLVVAPGTYAVHAAFTPAARAGKPGALRRFALALTFSPAATPVAARCHRLEDGAKPPAKPFVHG